MQTWAEFVIQHTTVVFRVFRTAYVNQIWYIVERYGGKNHNRQTPATRLKTPTTSDE